MSATDGVRQAHAHLDLVVRERKARKVAKLMGLQPGDRSKRVLEVGTGAGGIAHFFSQHLGHDVVAVDVGDHRVVRDGYEFHQVEGVALPFDDDSFDLVISNHVVEHVGDADAQHRHVTELHRVLRPGGVAYLAVPNRWMPIEPHYRLAFLSWLPENWRTPYLRWSGRGGEYDCLPLTAGRAMKLLSQAGFNVRQVCGEAVRATYELENPDSRLYKWLWRWLPDGAYRPLRSIFPTLIYLLAKSDFTGRDPEHLVAPQGKRR